MMGLRDRLRMVPPTSCTDRPGTSQTLPVRYITYRAIVTCVVRFVSGSRQPRADSSQLPGRESPTGIAHSKYNYRALCFVFRIQYIYLYKKYHIQIFGGVNKCGFILEFTRR